MPLWVKLVRREPGETDYYQGITCQKLANAFHSCKGKVMRERLAEGFGEAQRIRRAVANTIVVQSEEIKLKNEK